MAWQTFPLVAVLRQITPPTYAAAVASVGLHALFFSLLQAHVDRQFELETSQTVEVVELSNEALQQLPDFARPGLPSDLENSYPSLPPVAFNSGETDFSTEFDIENPLSQTFALQESYPQTFTEPLPYNWGPLPPPPVDWSQTLPVPPVLPNLVQLPSIPEASTGLPPIPDTSTEIPPSPTQVAPLSEPLPPTSVEDLEPSVEDLEPSEVEVQPQTPLQSQAELLAPLAQPPAVTSPAPTSAPGQTNAPTPSEGSASAQSPSPSQDVQPSPGPAATIAAVPQPEQETIDEQQQALQALQEQYRHQYAYNSAGTSPGEAAANLERWLGEIRSATQKQDLTPQSPQSNTLAFQDPVCPRNVGPAGIVILIDAYGNPVTSPQLILSTGYNILDQDAIANVGGRGFSATGDYEVYQYYIGFQDLNGVCQVEAISKGNTSPQEIARMGDSADAA